MLRRCMTCVNAQFLMGFILGVVVTMLMRLNGKSADVTVNRPHVAAGKQSVFQDQPNDMSGNKEVFQKQMQAAMDRLPDTHIEQFGDSGHHHDNTTVADHLYKNVRVLCWIATHSRNYKKKTIHVKNTWARRCNILLFIGNKLDEELGNVVMLNVTEGRNHLTAKTMLAFKYIYDHYYNDADWFLKADDDAYVIVENLRYLLSNKNPMDPLYFGQRFSPFVKQGYASGGAGYVISKGALSRFVKKGFNNTKFCHMDLGAEDMEFGRCMENLGVLLGSSHDVMGRSRFHGLTVDNFINNILPSWMKEYSMDGVRGGVENISDYAISFHYVKPRQMYVMEYLVYHLQPYGLIPGLQNLNPMSIT